MCLAVANRVVEERLNDPFEELVLDRDGDRLGRDRDPELDSRGVGVASHRGGGTANCVARVAGRPGEPGLQPGGGHERVDGARHLLGVVVDGFEAGAVVVAASRLAQRELGLGSDSRERCPQLVGELRRESLLVADARGQTFEQGVERRSESGELVVRLPGANRWSRSWSLQAAASSVMRETGCNALPRIQRVSNVTATSSSDASAIDPTNAIVAVSS